MWLGVGFTATISVKQKLNFVLSLVQTIVYIVFYCPRFILTNFILGPKSFSSTDQPLPPSPSSHQCHTSCNPQSPFLHSFSAFDTSKSPMSLHNLSSFCSLSLALSIHLNVELLRWNKKEVKSQPSVSDGIQCWYNCIIELSSELIIMPSGTDVAP